MSLSNVWDLTAEFLTLGDILRLASASHSMRQVVYEDHSFWSGYYTRIGLINFRSKTLGRLVTHVRNSQSRCCQCACTTRSKVTRTNGRVVPLCVRCSRFGYSRLFTRREVIESLAKQNDGMRLKQRLLPWHMQSMCIAKRSFKGKHFYWYSSVAHLLRKK